MSSSSEDFGKPQEPSQAKINQDPDEIAEIDLMKVVGGVAVTSASLKFNIDSAQPIGTVVCMW